MAAHPIEEALIAELRELPADKQLEVLEFVRSLQTKPKRPLKSLYGLRVGHGVDISEEDIAEARKEMWGNFPREHLFD